MLEVDGSLEHKTCRLFFSTTFFLLRKYAHIRYLRIFHLQKKLLMAKEILLNNKNLYQFTGDKNHNFLITVAWAWFQKWNGLTLYFNQLYLLICLSLVCPSIHSNRLNLDLWSWLLFLSFTEENKRKNKRNYREKNRMLPCSWCL